MAKKSAGVVSKKKASKKLPQKKTMDDLLEEYQAKVDNLKQANGALVGLSATLSSSLGEITRDRNECWLSAKRFAGQLDDIDTRIACVLIRLETFAHAVCNIRINEVLPSEGEGINCRRVSSSIDGVTVVRFLHQIAKELDLMQKILDHESHVSQFPEQEVSKDVESKQ